jgi:hypothetical protein
VWLLFILKGGSTSNANAAAGPAGYSTSVFSATGGGEHVGRRKFPECAQAEFSEEFFIQWSLPKASIKRLILEKREMQRETTFSTDEIEW